jgi:5'-nucleotidase
MILLVDMDDVIANTELGFHQKLEVSFPQIAQIAPEQRTCFDFEEQYPLEVVQQITHAPGYFASLPPVPGAIDALRAISASGIEVKICTSPLLGSPTCASEKLAWVKRLLGSAWQERLIITRDKTIVRGDILIDDKPELKGCATPTWEHVIFSRPWNQQVKSKRRLESWEFWRSVVGV